MWPVNPTARYLAMTLSLLLIVGCAVERGIGLPDLSDWNARTRTLASLMDWQFKGRIGVSTGNEGFNGELRYSQIDNGFRAMVSGPLGFGTIRLEGYGRSVTVIDKDGEEWILTDPEIDLHTMYGWTIPVTNLRFWALGIPNPTMPANTEFNEDGLLVSLTQDTWLIKITQYRDGGGQLMPRRLSAISGENKIRLVIDNWIF
jgi:outer membrane lipoprotein LolB